MTERNCAIEITYYRVRDWSLITGRGGYKTGGVLTWELEVLAIVMGDAKGLHPLKGGAQGVLPCLECGGGGAQNVSDPRFFHFVQLLTS